MQTYLRDDARGEDLGIGSVIDHADLRPADILNSGYQLVQEPQPGEPIRLLETWTDPSCGRGDLWALVTIVDGRVASIVAVPLDRMTLAQANYISDNCFIIAATLAGVRDTDLVTGKVSCVDALRAYLPHNRGAG
ncbi:MAG: hypothetical protein R3B06_04745 [Kofleriaceae bacterium]